jgi:hypothetical protein
MTDGSSSEILIMTYDSTSEIQIITYGCHRDLVNRYIIFFTNNDGCATFVVITSRSFPHARLITGIVTRIRPRVPLVEDKLLTLLLLVTLVHIDFF